VVGESGLSTSRTGAFRGNCESPRIVPIRGAEGLDLAAQGTDRSVRTHHSLELADEPDCLQSGASARRWVHDGSQAE
jgi:hypothetical protein